MPGKPLYALLQSQLGVDPHPRINPEGSAVGIAATKMLSNNPNRMGLTIINLSAFSIYLMLDNSVSAAQGILLDPNGGSMSLNWEYDMTLVSNEWWAISVGGVGTLLIVEVNSI